jgi:hypothetical protein
VTPQEGEASAYSKAKDNSTVLQPRLFSRRPIVSRVRMVLPPAEHCVAASVWNTYMAHTRSRTQPVSLVHCSSSSLSVAPDEANIAGDRDQLAGINGKLIGRHFSDGAGIGGQNNETKPILRPEAR